MNEDIWLETMQSRTEWCTIYRVLKEKNHRPRILYSAKIAFKNETEIKIFLGIQKLEDFSTKNTCTRKM